ncbi:MAG: peptidylprolyl isomerase [Terriglobia bacterium]
MSTLRKLLIASPLLVVLNFLGCGGQPSKETAPPPSAEKTPPAQEAPKPVTPAESAPPAEIAPKETAVEAPVEKAPLKKPMAKSGTGTEAAKPAPAKPAGPPPALLDPSQAKEKAPDQYKVKFETTKGDFVVLVTRNWAPLGADRFYNLVKAGYFTDAAFFRVIGGFMAQFGIHGDPKVNEKWEPARIQDDPVKESNVRGMVSFATAGPGTRTTQLFINFGDNSKLDAQGFSPFGKVVDGMQVVDALHKDYGEGYPYGRGPSQGRIQAEGNNYLKSEFPNLDYIKRAVIVK